MNVKVTPIRRDLFQRRISTSVILCRSNVIAVSAVQFKRNLLRERFWIAVLPLSFYPRNNPVGRHLFHSLLFKEGLQLRHSFTQGLQRLDPLDCILNCCLLSENCFVDRGALSAGER